MEQRGQRGQVGGGQEPRGCRVARRGVGCRPVVQPTKASSRASLGLGGYRHLPPTRVDLGGQHAAQPGRLLQQRRSAEAGGPGGRQRCRQQPLRSQPGQQLVEARMLQQHRLHAPPQVQRRLQCAAVAAAGLCRRHAAAARHHARHMQQQRLLPARGRSGVAGQPHDGRPPRLQLVRQPVHARRRRRDAGARLLRLLLLSLLLLLLLLLRVACCRPGSPGRRMLLLEQRRQQQRGGGQHVGATDGRRQALAQGGHRRALRVPAAAQLLSVLLQGAVSVGSVAGAGGAVVSCRSARNTACTCTAHSRIGSRTPCR